MSYRYEVLVRIPEDLKFIRDRVNEADSVRTPGANNVDYGGGQTSSRAVCRSTYSGVRHRPSMARLRNDAAPNARVRPARCSRPASGD
jgi:hypothetical protein